MSGAKTYAVGALDTVNLSGGTCVAILSTSVGAVNVTVWKGGTQLAKFTGVQGGLNWTSRNQRGDLEPFDLVEIYSTDAQNVIAFTGFGDVAYTRSQGDVTVTNAPNITTVANVADITPDSLSVAYHRHSGSAALNTIVAPASNTAGVEVYGAFVMNSAGAMERTRVMAKDSAPASVDDTTANTLAIAVMAYPIIGAHRFPIKLPIGMGLYEQSSSAAGASTASVTYRVL